MAFIGRTVASLQASTVIRRIADEGEPPVTVRLVSWADEEGARFSRSLFGSAAVAGTLDVDILRQLTDRAGDRLAPPARPAASTAQPAALSAGTSALALLARSEPLGFHADSRALALEACQAPAVAQPHRRQLRGPADALVSLECPESSSRHCCWSRS